MWRLVQSSIHISMQQYFPSKLPANLPKILQRSFPEILSMTLQGFLLKFCQWSSQVFIRQFFLAFFENFSENSLRYSHSYFSRRNPLSLHFSKSSTKINSRSFQLFHLIVILVKNHPDILQQRSKELVQNSVTSFQTFLQRIFHIFFSRDSFNNSRICFPRTFLRFLQRFV